MALGDDPALLVGVNQRGDRRNIETRLDPVAFEQLEDARHADAIAVLAPGEAPDRLAAVAQIAGLMIAVEGQRHRAARGARPLTRAQRASGAHPLDQLLPMRVRPLPGFEIGFRSGHGLSPGASAPTKRMLGAVERRDSNSRPSAPHDHTGGLPPIADRNFGGPTSQKS